MPTPITHIVLGKKIHQHFFSHLDFPSFIVGTSFPDIHSISQLNREQTHSQKIHLKDIDTKDPFLAGFQVHSLVDNIVNCFKQNEILSISSKESVDNRVILSIYRDKILYPKINNWPQIRSFFSRVYPQETDMGISVKNIQEWHAWLQEYFEKKPLKESLEVFFNTFDPKHSLNEIVKTFEEIDKNPIFKKDILDLTENIISLVEKE